MGTGARINPGSGGYCHRARKPVGRVSQGLSLHSSECAGILTGSRRQLNTMEELFQRNSNLAFQVGVAIQAIDVELHQGATFCGSNRPRAHGLLTILS